MITRNEAYAKEYVTIQSCIDGVRDKDVFVIATTNDLENIPQSLLKSGRFDWIFKLRVPRYIIVISDFYTYNI